MASWWPGERGVDQVAAIRVALVDGELVAVLDGAADLVDVGEVDLRVDAAGCWGSCPASPGQTLPVRSPLPNRQPSIRSAPA